MTEEIEEQSNIADIDGVWVTIDRSEKGGVKISGVSTTGDATSAEVQTILELGLKAYRISIGL